MLQRCQHPAQDHCTSLIFLLMPLTFCCRIPATGQAALLLALNSTQFTLSCISLFCLTYSLDILRLQHIYRSPSMLPCNPLAEENSIHNPSSCAVANGAKHATQETKWCHAIQSNRLENYVFFLCLEREFLFLWQRKANDFHALHSQD